MSQDETPSRRDGIGQRAEFVQRVFACEMIQEAGILLELPQVVMVSAQTLFHRFYQRVSMKEFTHILVAASSLFVACKIEERLKRLAEVATTFHYCFARRVMSQRKLASQRSVPLLDPHGYTGFEWKSEITRMERFLLKEIGFVLQFQHPHKYILMYCNTLQQQSSHDSRTWKSILQMAWNAANDSMRTDLCLRLAPEAVACGCIYNAVQRVGIDISHFKTGGNWYTVFSAKTEDVESVQQALREVYDLGTTLKSFQDLTNSRVEDLAFVNSSGKASEYIEFARGDSKADKDVSPS